MAQASPLTKGLPFFVFMAAGTFVLSLFVQQRNDYAVRTPLRPSCEISSELTSSASVSVMQDRHKRAVNNEHDSAKAPTLREELQVLVLT